jgi:hypothetical protein
MIREPGDMNLHQGAKDGYLPLVASLVEFGYYVDALGADGRTVLFYAVEYENRDVIKKQSKCEKQECLYWCDSCSLFGEDRKRDFISFSC